MTTKYIKDKRDNIIVFPATMKHSEFKHFEPVSAGFISFGVDREGNPSCTCYGKSESLDLESDPIDTWLAERQIVRRYY